MKILLCAATTFEIAPTVERLPASQNHSIEIIITGVGLMVATYALMKAIHRHQPDLILQAGIAGTFDADKNLGDVVAVKTDVVGDLGVQEKSGFQTLFDLKFLDNNLYPYSNAQLKNDHEILSACGLPTVAAVSVNEISTSVDRIAFYRTVYRAEIESMEGAALHYVGLMERIPFLQIRSLSNFIGERDKTKWMMQKAITNLNRELDRILKITTA